MGKFIKVAAALALPVVAGSVMAIAPPAFADSGGCLWGTQSGGNSVTAPGGTVTVNGVVFSCSIDTATTSSPYQWAPAGTTDGDNTPGLSLTYSGFEDPANFSPGAVLDGGGNAMDLGSSWTDIGSMSDFQNSLTPCVDTSCDGVGGGGDGGGIGGLQP
jgi:hypothetical protein